MSTFSIVAVFVFAVAVAIKLFRSASSGWIFWAVALSAVSVMVGVFTLTGATEGIGMIVVGVYVAIIGRILQAEDHHSRTAGTAESSLRNASRQKEIPHSKSDRWLWAVALFLIVSLGAVWFSEKQRTRTEPRDIARSQPARNSYTTPAPRDTYTGQITQTGTDADTGAFYIVLDDFVQCFFRDQDLSVEKRKMQQFQSSPALRLTVSGALAPDHTPPLGEIRYDACRIEGWE